MSDQPKEFFLAGKFCRPAVASVAPVRNPYTGENFASVHLAGEAEIEAALAAMVAVAPELRRQPGFRRAEILLNLARGLEAGAEEFAQVIMQEGGKPIVLARREVQRAIMTFTAAAEEARREQGRVLDAEAFAPGAGHFALTRRFPVGPIYGITPFNFPLNLVVHKLAPALASGNPILLKPAPATPLTALLLAELLGPAGVLPGQVSVLPMPNALAGRATGDPRIRMVSFTGSPTVGWGLRARTPKAKVTLELGGNAAVIVHGDADWESAVPAIATGAFAHAGQSCISVQRIYVQRQIYAAFRARLLAHIAAHVRAGDPADERVLVGPLINSAAVERVRGWLVAAREAGARFACGGPESIRVENCLLEPTVIEDAMAELAVCAEEVFAPLAAWQPYDQFSDALNEVNRSPFGLQAGVFTRDIGLAFQAHAEIEAGAVLINQVPTFRLDNLPYGGVKDSGAGGREGLQAAIQDMTEERTLVVKVN